MPFPQKNTILDIKSENIKQHPNNAAEEHQITISEPWKKFILRQIDKSGPMIAEALSYHLIPVIEKIGAKILKKVDHLSELKALQEAYENRWILSTSQLAKLLGVEPQVLLKYNRFEHHGFIFFRHGKVLSEIGWAIGKNASIYDDDY